MQTLLEIEILCCKEFVVRSYFITKRINSNQKIKCCILSSIRVKEGEEMGSRSFSLQFNTSSDLNPEIIVSTIFSLSTIIET